MAFWIRKQNPDKAEPGKESEGLQAGKRKKEDKKAPSAKRVDNLRIPQQLKIVLKSLGSQAEYQFLTKDLSATGAFVVCPNVWAYPFQQASTILDCIVDLHGQAPQDTIKIRFLAKIARYVESAPGGQTGGFGIRIVQMSMDQRHLLENYIARHGTPEFMGSGMESRTATKPEHGPEEELLSKQLPQAS